MCRSIKRLNIKNQKATNEEIYEAARQYVRKVCGFREPSLKNKDAFEIAISKITEVTAEVLTKIAKGN